MKKSLLKSLALVGLVLSFASCDDPIPSSSVIEPPEPISLTIAQATEWDTDEGKTVQDGVKVKITDAVVNNVYGNSLIVQQTFGESLDGISAVEVITDGPVTFGWGDVLNVVGIVGDIGGRPVIKDASLEYAVDEATSKATGEVYGYGALSRAGFDAIAVRRTSGMLMWGTSLQLVTLPGTVVADTPTEFKVAFRGEKLDANSPIAIPVVVPAMTEAQAEIVNDFFADVNGGAEDTTPTPAAVGDAFDFCAPVYWQGGEIGFVFGPYGPQLSEGFKEVEGVFDDWGDIEVVPGLFLDELFAIQLPDLSKAGTEIFNYVVELAYVEEEPGLLSGLLITAYSDDADADFVILSERISDDVNGWVMEEEEDGYVAFILSDGDDLLGAIQLENVGNYVNIWISAVVPEADLVSWETVIAQLEASASALLDEEFISALPLYNDPDAEGFVFDDSYAEDHGVFFIDVYTIPGSTYDFGTDLEATGFEAGYNDEYEQWGYFNEDSGEVVWIDLSQLADYGIVTLEIYL